MHTEQKKILGTAQKVEGVEPRQPEFSGRQKFSRAGINSEELALCVVSGIARESAINLGREVVRNNRTRRIERQIKRLGIWRD